MCIQCFLDMGVGEGDRPVVLLDNCIPYLEVSYASAEGGMIVVPLNTGPSESWKRECNRLAFGESETRHINP